MQPSLERSQVETQLIAFIESLEARVSGWRAIHVQLSQLEPHNRRHLKLHMAVSAFGGLLERFKGELFQLPHGDIFYCWHGGATAEVQQVVLGLCCLFSDDPLIKAGGDHIEVGEAPDFDGVRAGAAIQRRFYSWFELECEYDTLCLRVQQSVAEARGNPISLSVDHRRPLDPSQLASIETL